MEKGIPKSFKKLVGKEHTMSGCLFGRKEIEPTKFTVLDARWGSGVIMDMKTLKDKHPTVQLLVKNDTMIRSRWTRGFPAREIKLKNNYPK